MKKKKKALYKNHSDYYMITKTMHREEKLERKKKNREDGTDNLFSQAILHELEMQNRRLFDDENELKKFKEKNEKKSEGIDHIYKILCDFKEETKLKHEFNREQIKIKEFEE
jgi:hypothetical protein